MLEFRFDTQLLIEGHGLDEDAIHDYIQRNIAGDCPVSYTHLTLPTIA